jgi:hypothetical protein
MDSTNSAAHESPRQLGVEAIQERVASGTETTRAWPIDSRVWRGDKTHARIVETCRTLMFAGILRPPAFAIAHSIGIPGRA